MGFATRVRRRGWRHGLLLPAATLLGVLLLSRAVDGVSTFEGLSLAAVLVGVAVAVGDPRGGRADRVLRAEDDLLADLAQSTLATLDPVEHRRLELGDPWPQLVVGPTGVSIIDFCPRDPGGLGDGPDGQPVACAHCDDLSVTATAVRRLLGERGDERSIHVRALSVVPPGTASVASQHTGAALIPSDMLRDTLVRGPVLPMATVDDVFHFLTQRDVGAHTRRH